MKPFDENAMLAKVYQRAGQEGLRSRWTKRPQESSMKTKAILFTAFTLIIALTVVLLNPFGSLNPDTSKTVAAIVSVDINPSFELSVNNAGVVVKIDALNADAESLDTSDLIGLPVEEAVDKIVALAEEAGFIDTTDLIDDYVVVSTCLMDGTQTQLADTLQTRLRDRIQLSDSLQAVNLVQIKATLQEQFQAREKDIPIGLYVINASIQNQNGEILSVKEFFSDEANREAIQNRAQITPTTKEKVRERVETALNQLDSNGVDTTEIRTRLENASEETMIQIQAEVQTKLQQQNPDNGNGNPDSGSGEGSGSGSGSPSDSGSGTPSDSGSGSGSGAH